jgi:quinohemoprotein ethanol dehydrogenase
LKQGSKIYQQYCFPCFGPVDYNYGALPDLGHMQKVKFDLLDNIVLKGLLQPLGMPNFGDRLSPAQVDIIKKYIASSAKQIGMN